ncbi:hypothetical protein L226DRAFT_570819 [Lentinus tigrinus ALCF2SS1-7]|uniref:Uncharacterized protein n=1 Tax=Lentinus tigrinus ALCF2SS1-6 TaxID=1328759 RepID=A0A5C2SB70_9APHY|nr:hypothetical protein L227DRAFT_610664 [Lentinus tigrinus ALCF2SS1-6]RPD75158.1 hypothetical protein L226DRAFT_570819 [Lentinus tigrinus ALCF2SS1-7]
MVPSTASVEPSLSRPHPFARSDSIASSSCSVASSSGAGLQRRSRTRTRSLASTKRGRSQGPPAGSSKYESDAGESFLDLDDAPPVPTLVHDEPEEMTPREKQEVKKTRRRSRTIGPETRPPAEGLHPEMPPMARSWSALDVRDPSQSEHGRGRQAKSDNGSLKGAKARLRGLSLPRQSFRQNSPSDCSSQPSPQTPYGFGEVPPVPITAGVSRNPRDSLMTQVSGTSSSVYPASTSAGTRTESSMPYTDDQFEADMSYPEIVTPEHPDFDPDDVSNRLRLLLNNSYFLPPAHAKPTPNALSPHAQEPSKRTKPGNTGFLDFFRIGKSKSKPTSPVPGSPPAVDSTGPILRTTSDTPTASGLLLRSQPSQITVPAASQPPPPPASRVVVLRERMDDLETAAKEAEKELRKAGPRKTRSQSTPRDRYLDDVIDPTDAVDLPPPSADSIFAVQASAVYGLGPQDSVGAAVLADRLVPGSPGIWSISSEEDSWRKELLREAVSHSLGNTPDHSFSSSISSNPAQPPASPPPQSEATFPTPAMLEAQKPKVGQRILEDLDIRTESSESPPQSPLDGQSLPVKSSMSSGEKSPKAIEHPVMTDATPARAETPAYMPLPLAPAPRKQLVNPLYSLSQPDLSDPAANFDGPSPASSSASYHTVRKATSTPGLSGAEEAQRQRAMLSLSPPPLPGYQSGKRGISPDSRDLAGMPSFSSTSRSRTGSDSRYSSDSMSFRTPMETDVEQTGARPSMTLSLPSERPSISVSVSEYSMPSPTASAFRDAVFGSCRPPSVMSRRSVASHPEPLAQEIPIPPPPVTPHSAVGTTPPPRVSSSVRPNELPIPPRPPAVRPTHRPSTSTYNSRSSRSRSASKRSPVVSEHSPAQDAFGNSSFSSSQASSSPLAARRGLGSPLSLSIPSGYQPPVIHSAPAPASPTDFFDRIQSIHNAMDDLDTSDESESEDELSLNDENARSRFNHGPPGESPRTLRSNPPSVHSVPERVEVTRVFVEPRTQAISNRASSSSARPSIMRLGNHSTPQLSPVSHFSSPQEPLPQYNYDRKKPIGNVADLGRRSFSSSRSPFKSKGKGKGIVNVPNSPLLPIGAMPSSPIAPGTSFGRASVSSASSAAPITKSKGRRPATAPDTEGDRLAPGGRKVQRESIQRFDGMLMQHLVAERDRMKRITSDYATSSATSSPVVTRPPGQLPLGR